MIGAFPWSANSLLLALSPVSKDNDACLGLPAAGCWPCPSGDVRLCAPYIQACPGRFPRCGTSDSCPGNTRALGCHRLLTSLWVWVLCVFFFFLHTAHPLGRCTGPLVSLWRGKATVIHGPASLQPSPLTLWGGHTQLLAKEGTLHFPMQLRFFGLYLRDLIFDFPYTRVSRLCCELLLTDMRD